MCARFGANQQYWTFLLEVLTVTPEEVCTPVSSDESLFCSEARFNENILSSDLASNLSPYFADFLF